MQSDTKNQMSTKQIPFVFFIFFPFARFQCCAQETFPLYLHVHSWTGSCPCSLSHCPFLVITSQGKGVRKAASAASPKDVPLFHTQWNECCSLLGGHHRLSQNDCFQTRKDIDSSREKARVHQKSKQGRVERYLLCWHMMDKR